MKCPSCGGSLKYNIASEKLECEYCKSEFIVQEYSEKNEGEKKSLEFENIRMDTYSCKNCGAKLDAPEEQTVAYCMYCGGQATLLQKSQPSERPSRILPFRVTKDKVKSAYEKEVSKALFAPKELTKPEYLEGFRGIYIPYWFTKSEIESGEEVELSGETSQHQVGYDLIKTYDYKAKFGGVVESGCYDASAAFDDTIAADIAPFYADETVNFNEGYLAGFYSDKATTSVEAYKEKIDDDVAKNLAMEIKRATKGIVTKVEDIKKKVSWKSGKNRTILFPVWFLTWRKKDRVAYGIMNGQTGKLSADIPVDLKKFFKVGIILSLIMFGIMSLLPSFILPIKVACFSSFFAYFSSMILKAELRSIRLRETHAYDWGNAASKKKKADSGIKALLKKLNVVLSVVIGIHIVNLLFYAGKAYMPVNVRNFYSCMLAFQLIVTIKQIYEIRGVKNKAAIIPIIFAVLVHVAGIFIPHISRQQDFWYYTIAISCFVSMMMNCLTSIFYINYLATRPVPNFFTRKGAENGAK